MWTGGAGGGQAAQPTTSQAPRGREAGARQPNASAAPFVPGQSQQQQGSPPSQPQAAPQQPPATQGQKEQSPQQQAQQPSKAAAAAGAQQRPNAAAAPFVPKAGTNGSAPAPAAGSSSPTATPASGNATASAPAPAAASGGTAGRSSSRAGPRLLPVGTPVRVRDTEDAEWYPGTVVAHKQNSLVIQTREPEAEEKPAEDKPEHLKHEPPYVRTGYLPSRNEWAHVEQLPTPELLQAAMTEATVENFRKKKDYGFGTFQHDQCSLCGTNPKVTSSNNTTRLRPCPCREVMYCNQTCQKQHWYVHKFVCAYSDKHKRKQEQAKTDQAKQQPAQATQQKARATSPVGAGATASPAPTGPVRKRLELLYRRYAPTSLGVLEGQLQKYAGKEEELMQELVQRLGPEPTESEVVALESCGSAAVAAVGVLAVQSADWVRQIHRIRDLLMKQTEAVARDDFQTALQCQQESQKAVEAAEKIEAQAGTTSSAVTAIQKALKQSQQPQAGAAAAAAAATASPPAGNTQTHMAGCCTVLVSGSKRAVLLCRGDNARMTGFAENPMWRLPFALAQRSESLQQAAIRAVLSEVSPNFSGADLQFRGLLAVQQTHDSGLLFVCALTPGAQGTTPCNFPMYPSARWVPIEEMLEMPSETVLPPLRSLREEGPLTAWLNRIPAEGVEESPGPVPNPPGLVTAPPTRNQGGMAWWSAGHRPVVPSRSCLRVRWTPLAQQAAAAAENQERRRDPTETDPAQQHRAYTHSQFIEFYGKDEGERLWVEAAQLSLAPMQMQADTARLQQQQAGLGAQGLAQQQQQQSMLAQAGQRPARQRQRKF
eukprot:Hpha_TRINITY_DN16523_c5_g3::TRINITY_DN16523_c5_g3_i1::g.137021::m.137021